MHLCGLKNFGRQPTLLLFYLTTGKFLVVDAISKRSFIIFGAKRLPKFVTLIVKLAMIKIQANVST